MSAKKVRHLCKVFAVYERHLCAMCAPSVQCLSGEIRLFPLRCGVCAVLEKNQGLILQRMDLPIARNAGF